MAARWGAIGVCVCALLAACACTAHAETVEELSSAVQVPKCVTPLCTWQCVVPKCKKRCTPQCHKPDCHMKCRKQCASCTIHCPPPECKVLCPKYHCPMQGCPACKIVCDPKPQDRCVAKCEAPNPTCWPACNTNCWNKCEKKCDGPDPLSDHPFCHLICRKPEDFGLVCPPNQCKPPCELPNSNAASGASCCPCTNSSAAAAAMRFADSMPWAADTAHIARPSLLEVVETFREQDKRGHPSCCPCAHNERREQAVSSDAEREDDVFNPSGDALRPEAGQERAERAARSRRLQASQAQVSYDSLSAASGAGVNNAEPTEKPGPRYPIWPGYPSPVGAQKETTTIELPR